MANQRVDISSLSLPELQELHQQLSKEVESFTSNMMALQQTAGRFASAGQSIEALKGREKGQPVLLPMTESLYVSGSLDSVETVLLEIGTGYYIEVGPYFQKVRWRMFFEFFWAQQLINV